MTINSRMLLTCASLASGLYPLSAQAVPCGGFGPNFDFCKRCTTTSERSTKRDRPCGSAVSLTHPFASGAGQEKAVLGLSVVKQAQHGRVEVRGASWVYTPAKGYVGKDNLTLEWDMFQNGQAYVLYSDVHMTVE